MTLHSTTRLKIWFVLAGVFVIGCVTGAALDGFYRTRAGGGGKHGDRERRHEKMFEETRRELGLNEEQAAKMRTILDETRDEYRALRQELRPRFDAIRQKARARMKETLTAEQQKRFDEMTARREQKKNGHRRDESK